jgi:hypothetical protein
MNGHLKQIKEFREFDSAILAARRAAEIAKRGVLGIARDTTFRLRQIYVRNHSCSHVR